MAALVSMIPSLPRIQAPNESMFKTEPEIAESPKFLTVINLTAVILFTLNLLPTIGDFLCFQ